MKYYSNGSVKGINGFYDGLDPTYGYYICTVTNENGSIDKYYYQNEVDEVGTLPKVRGKSKLALLKKETHYESNAAGSDGTTIEYTYDDAYAVTSPSRIKTTERIDGVERVYYNDYAYDEECSLLKYETLNMTEAEATAETIPEEKKIVTTYQELDNRMFLPKTTTSYQSANVPVTESIDYDSLGRAIKVTNALGEESNTEYTNLTYPWQPTAVWYSDPEKKLDEERVIRTEYTYGDSYGLGATKETLISTEGTYVAAETVYDPKYGNVIETKDANGISTTYEYDNLGRVTRIRYPSYQEYEGIRYLREDITYTDSSAYNGRYYYLVTSKCYESTEGDSVSTANRVSFAYTHFDDNGNVVKEQNDIGTQTYQYDNANRLESYKDLGDTANDNTEHEVPFTYRYSYDLFGNLITITDRHGSIYEIDYKSLSTEYCFNPYDSDTNENYYVVNYDMYGNTISESTYPNGRDAAPLTTTYTYDLHGNQLSVTDANDKTTTYEYDKLGQAVKAMQPDGSVIRNQYNKWGKAANVIRDGEEERSQISYTYNDRGLESGIRQKGRDIESPAWQYQYNAKGLLASIEEPSGNQVSYAYDHSDRVTYKKAGSKEYDYCYNFRGQLIETNEFVNHTKTSKYKLYLYYQDGKILYSEDEYGLLAYNYTKRGNVTYLGGSPESRNYTRNTEDRLVQLTSLNQSLSYDYYANGLVKSITYPNTSIVTNYTYDDIGRLLRLKTTKGTRVIRDYQYTYDGVGNILTITGSENVTYTYDDLYRLKTYTKNGVTTTYEYGDRNNLTAERQTNSDGDTISYITYTYTGDNRLKSKTSGEESIVYQYDLNGNLISDSTGNQYWYDEENKLVKSKVDEVVTTYDNGLDGYRHKKQSGDTTTKYYVDIYGRVAQEQIGSQKVQIIWDDSRPVARVVDDTWYYYLWNAHGDIVGLLDENGNEVNTYEYDPWGKVETANETIPNPIRYAGEYYDEEVEFIYLRARYYSPNERRFTQEDPARDELDWYVYCGNNPVMFVDSSGLKDYIYTSRDEYYIENDKGKCEFLCIDRYYIEIDGSRYRANSKETVTLYDWNKIDMEFTSKTLKRLVNKANLKKTTAKRIMKESVGGDLDFKLQLNESTLYLSDGVVYNRNEAGNFIWAYFLESKKVSGYISGALAQGGSIATPLLNKNGTPRFDESWDVRARWMGVRYYYESNNKLWLFRILYGDKYRFHDIK